MIQKIMGYRKVLDAGDDGILGDTESRRKWDPSRIQEIMGSKEMLDLGDEGIQGDTGFRRL